MFVEGLLAAAVITIFPGDWAEQQIDRVELERQDGAYGQWKVIQTITTPAIQIQVTDLQAVGYVSYRSRSHNAGGYSPYAVPANILIDSDKDIVFIMTTPDKNVQITRRKGDTSKQLPIIVNKSQALVVNNAKR